MLRGLLFAVLLTGCARPVAPPPQSAPSPLLARPAPDFSRPALDGSRVSFAALRGRPVVVEFFAKHCRPCAKSLPEIEALRASLPGVHVVGISEDEGEGEASSVVAEHALRFPVVHDRDHVLAGRFRVSDLPATFIVDAGGVVRWHGATTHSAAQLRAVIESLANAATAP